MENYMLVALICLCLCLVFCVIGMIAHKQYPYDLNAIRDFSALFAVVFLVLFLIFTFLYLTGITPQTETFVFRLFYFILLRCLVLQILGQRLSLAFPLP